MIWDMGDTTELGFDSPSWIPITEGDVGGTTDLNRSSLGWIPIAEGEVVGNSSQGRATVSLWLSVVINGLAWGLLKGRETTAAKAFASGISFRRRIPIAGRG